MLIYPEHKIHLTQLSCTRIEDCLNVIVSRRNFNPLEILASWPDLGIIFSPLIDLLLQKVNKFLVGPSAADLGLSVT